MADFATLAVASRGGVLHVTLNRPAVRNAMSLQMVDDLRDVLAQAEAGGDVRAIVLRGAGGHFCAGADLQDMAQARQRELAGDTEDRKSTRLNSSHLPTSRMPSSA